MYDYYNDYKKIESVLEKLRKILKNIPIIFTIKRNASHGEAEISKEDYVKIYKEVCLNKMNIINIESEYQNIKKSDYYKEILYIFDQDNCEI